MCTDEDNDSPVLSLSELHIIVSCGYRGPREESNLTRDTFASHSFIPHTRLTPTSTAHDLRRYLETTIIADLPNMNAPSKSRSSSATTARALRPQRPLPALPTISDTGPTIIPRSLAQDDFRSPFQLLQEHPLRYVSGAVIR